MKDWIAPSFVADSTQRVVTFKFPGADDAKRSCLFSVLSRFEYFQKALEHWQEGSSAEVCIADAEPEAFDLFLQYLHTGQVGKHLPLRGLLCLLELGNKYLIHHLVCSCTLRILRP